MNIKETFEAAIKAKAFQAISDPDAVNIRTLVEAYAIYCNIESESPIDEIKNLLEQGLLSDKDAAKLYKDKVNHESNARFESMKPIIEAVKKSVYGDNF